MFSDGDPLAVHTLAGAALGILSDLVEARKPGGSWRSVIAKDAGMTLKATNDVLNRVRNFLKHADHDPDGTLNFIEEETDDLLFASSIECGELGVERSFWMQAFELWYLAAYPERFESDAGPVKTAQRVIPDLAGLGRREKLARGATFIDDAR